MEEANVEVLVKSEKISQKEENNACLGNYGSSDYSDNGFLFY